MAGAPPPPRPALSLAWPLARRAPVQRQPCWCDGVAAVRHCCRRRCPRRSAMSCVRCETARSTAQGISAAVAQQSMVRGFNLLCPALLCFALRCAISCACRFVVFQRRSRWRTHACTHARALDASRAIRGTLHHRLTISMAISIVWM
jgi:hypothetical protein